MSRFAPFDRAGAGVEAAMRGPSLERVLSAVMAPLRRDAPDTRARPAMRRLRALP